MTVPGLRISFEEVPMNIRQIWISQRNLRRADQIPAMIEAIQEGDDLPRITLVRCEDGEVQLHDGHHRLAAYWLSGRRRLRRDEYTLLEQDHYHRPRCGRITWLAAKVDWPPSSYSVIIGRVPKWLNAVADANSRRRRER